MSAKEESYLEIICLYAIDNVNSDDMINIDGRLLSVFPLLYGASSIGMELTGDHVSNGNHRRCHSLKNGPSKLILLS